MQAYPGETVGIWSFISALEMLARSDRSTPSSSVCGGHRLLIRLKVAVARQAGAGGDELADDDVLLQAHQVVHLALDGGLGQTFVVSWKEAADRKESVASDALVMPMSMWVAGAGWAAHRRRCGPTARWRPELMRSTIAPESSSVSPESSPGPYASSGGR